MTANPGLLFVTSHILPTSDITAEQYDDFYNNEHLPDVLDSGLSGSQRVALRYKNSNPEAADPYLALYPTESTSSLWTGTGVSDILKGLQQNSKAKTLNNIDVSTFAAFGPRLYEKIQTYEAYGHESDTVKDRGQTIVCVAMEPGDETDFEDWYRKQHLDVLGCAKVI